MRQSDRSSVAFSDLELSSCPICGMHPPPEDSIPTREKVKARYELMARDIRKPMMRQVKAPVVMSRL